MCYVKISKGKIYKNICRNTTRILSINPWQRPNGRIKLPETQLDYMGFMAIKWIVKSTMGGNGEQAPDLMWHNLLYITGALYFVNAPKKSEIFEEIT